MTEWLLALVSTKKHSGYAPALSFHSYLFLSNRTKNRKLVGQQCLLMYHHQWFHGQWTLAICQCLSQSHSLTNSVCMLLYIILVYLTKKSWSKENWLEWKIRPTKYDNDCHDNDYNDGNSNWIGQWMAVSSEEKI